MIKARIALEKSRLKEKKADRLAQDEAAIKDAEQNVIATKNHFDVATTRLRSELERFELEKTEDIVMCLRNYLHAAVDGQRKIITLWETYVGAAR